MKYDRYPLLGPPKGPDYWVNALGGDNGGSVGPISGLLSPKRTAREAGDDPPDNEHTPCGNADQGGSEQQCYPSQSKNSDQHHKEGDADGPQPRNLDASSVVRAGGYPDPRRVWQTAPGGMISGSV